MRRNKQSLAVIALVLISVIGSVALVGGAAAQTDTQTQTETPTDSHLAEETLSVDNDTNAVQAIVENSTGTLDVTVYGVDDAGNETQVTTGTLDATSGPDATDTFKYSSVDPTTYAEYRVVVDGDAAESIEIAKVQTIPAGGGMVGETGLSLVEIAAGSIGILALIAAAALWRRR